MFLEATGRPIRYRLRDGRELVLRPGEPVDLPETSARKLLDQAAGKVRAVPDHSLPPVSGDALTPLSGATDPGPVTVEPGPSRLCYWEGRDGRIRAGRSVLLGMTVAGTAATFWIGIEDEGGSFRWVREDRLRLRAAFELRDQCQEGAR